MNVKTKFIFPELTLSEQFLAKARFDDYHTNELVLEISTDLDMERHEFGTIEITFPSIAAFRYQPSCYLYDKSGISRYPHILQALESDWIREIKESSIRDNNSPYDFNDSFHYILIDQETSWEIISDELTIKSDIPT